MKTFRKFIRAGRNVGSHFASEHIALFPFVGSLRRYNLGKLRADSHAALNVTLLAISQAIAFAAIAGLPVVYGVLCTAVAALVAPLFASSRYTIMGPTNATAFMLFSFFSVNPELAGRWGELVPLLVLMVGLIATLGSLLRVADLMQFVSRSVLVGYISGAAVLILANQTTHLLGVGKWIDKDSAGSFVGLVLELINVLSHTDWVSVGIGAATLVIYYGLMKWKPK